MTGRAVGAPSSRSPCPCSLPRCWWSSSCPTIRAVQIFDVVFAFTGGGPGSATLYIVHYIYNNGFASPFREYGLAAATSLVMASALIVLTIRAPLRVQGTGLEEDEESGTAGGGGVWRGLSRAGLLRNMLEPLKSALQMLLDGLGALLGGLLGTFQAQSLLHLWLSAAGRSGHVRSGAVAGDVVIQELRRYPALSAAISCPTTPKRRRSLATMTRCRSSMCGWKTARQRSLSKNGASGWRRRCLTPRSQRRASSR